MSTGVTRQAVRIALGAVAIDGDLHLPGRAGGLVVFAHGSGSSRFSPRNRAVAGALEDAGFGTLLLDLLTPEEEARDEGSAEHRFNIRLLSRRVLGAVEWTQESSAARNPEPSTRFPFWPRIGAGATCDGAF
jgi:hypothetical protein